MARYRRNPQTAGRIIDGQAFVVTPGDNKLHTLNETATLLWELAAGGVTLEDAALALSREFDVEAERAQRDAGRCFDDLVMRGMILLEQP